jgi:cupin 2 domain-containing protein
MKFGAKAFIRYRFMNMSSYTKISNLYENIPDSLPEELIDIIASKSDGEIRIERIVSRGHYSPSGYWYDQPRNEFVVLLKGSAGLRFEGSEDTVALQPGDWIDIPAHQKHRVEWTDPNQDTVWLAVHFP